MPSSLTPNMSLILPTVGEQPGPDYALNVNSDMSLIDTHDHSSGKGVPITPAGMNISTDLAFLGNSATGLYSIKFNPGSILTGGTNANRIYVSGVDLYYTDGNNNAVRISQGGQVAGSAGNITNLVSPASVVYSSLTETCTFQADTNLPMDLDAGSITIREHVTSGEGVTLSAPSSLSASYSIKFPGALPASQKFLTLDASGNLAATWAVDNSTIEVSSNSVRVKDLGITTAKLAADAVTNDKLADNAVQTENILDGDITSAKLQDDIDLPGTAVGPTSDGKQILVQAASTSTRLAILRGFVNTNGTVGDGEGFTSSESGNVYTVTFSAAFAATPMIIITPVFSPTLATNMVVGACVRSASTGSFTANSWGGTTSILAKTGFNFIAIGPKA